MKNLLVLVPSLLLILQGCSDDAIPEIVCNPECGEYDVCEDGNCVPIPCCEGYPEGEYHISIAGTVYDITTMLGVSVAIEVYRQFPGPPPEPPTPPPRPKSSDENGRFYLGCMEVSGFFFGILPATDDYSFDGAAGDYFPNLSPVAFWEKNSDIRCVYDAIIYALPSAIVTTLDAETSVDSASFGFVMGFVEDSSGNRVEGAVIKKSDGIDLPDVIYPDSTFTSFDGNTTSASGIFILPHTNFAAGIVEITAEKDGMIFNTEHAAPMAGWCFIVYIASRGLRSAREAGTARH